MLKRLTRVCRRAAQLAALVLLSVPALAQADAGAPTPDPAFTVDGFVSVGYSHNLNHPESRLNGLRVFDFDDGSFRVDVAELVLQHGTAKAGDVGFRFDLVAGGSIPRVSAAAGLFRDPATGVAQDVDLQQGYVSWIAPLGRGLRFDLGKQVTHAGAELIEGYDGWNDQYTRSILFGYAIPFTHTGVKATYAFSERVALMALVANGWDDVKDNNRGKSFGAQLALSPSKRFSAYVNYVGGPERAASDDARHLLDLIAVFRPSERLALTLNYDWAKEANGAGPGRDARWRGLAGYLRLGLSSSTALAVRVERFHDPQGVRTGLAQDVSEVTGTLEVKIKGGLLVRGDLRHDWSNRPAFEGRDGQGRKGQTTVAGNVAYAF